MTAGGPVRLTFQGFVTAGNAIGLGDFLRFPRQAALNGGGACLIPYFLALLLLGIPLMWVEWSFGRLGGRHGYGTTPGMSSHPWRIRSAKHVGALGVGLPLALVIYYNYIESWTLAFSAFSLSGKYSGILSRDGMGSFLHSYQGLEPGYLPRVRVAYGLFTATVLLNYWIISRGVVRGIEALISGWKLRARRLCRDRSHPLRVGFPDAKRLERDHHGGGHQASPRVLLHYSVGCPGRPAGDPGLLVLMNRRYRRS